MKCFIGLGSSLGTRRAHLEKAAKALKGLSNSAFLKVSPIYETPALMPENAPPEWNVPYLNAVAEIDWHGSATALLGALKATEVELGRTPAPRWAPRVIDLDLLTFGDAVLERTQADSGPQLTIPHPGIFERSFVLDPMKDLASSRRVPGQELPLALLARRLKDHTPLVMGIINATPDSFSDGGLISSEYELEKRLRAMDEAGVPIIDIGGESTRPGAALVSVEDEWQRIKPALNLAQAHFTDRVFKPLLSIDTRKSAVAEKALAAGADWINDVSALADPAMADLLASASCDIVLMHSLTVPADPKITLSLNQDPVAELKRWLELKLDQASRAGISLDRIIFDPGIGFGKTADQSIAILKRIAEFRALPVRVLVGHSRKSFMKAWGLERALDRDAMTLEVSRELATNGVDILRVHDYQSHLNAFHEVRA